MSHIKLHERICDYKCSSQDRIDQITSGRPCRHGASPHWYATGNCPECTSYT